MSTLVIDVYSDEDMHDPEEWQDGFKEGRLLSAGDAERPLSDAMTGRPQPATFKYALDDSDGRLRMQLVSDEDRYWGGELEEFYMTSRENRRVLGDPFLAFRGLIVDAQPVFPLAFDFTLADVITHAIIQDDLLVPWRKIGDGFLDQLDAVSDRLDREQTEPILYGRFTRTTEEEPTPPAAWPIIPIYLGLITVSGTQYHVWLSAGHACASQTIQVDGVDTSEGSDWLIATQAGWLAEFGTPYVDYPSSTYGNDRRYTLILGKFGEDTPDKCSQGEMQLTALIEGIEDVGDGSGSLITDYYQAYKHFTVNFLSNRGPFGYMSGNWLEELPGSEVDEASFDEASAIAAERRPGGLEVAAAIGISGRGVSCQQIIANWNISGFVRWGQPTAFEMGIVALHPTQAIKDAAPLYTDAYEILKESFVTTVEWNRHFLFIDYRGDYNPVTGVDATTGTVGSAENIKYNRSPHLEREYPYLPGRSQIEHLANIELLTIIHPPRVLKLETTIGEGESENLLAYLNSGDYIRYLHFDAVGGRTERLAQIITPVIRGDQRKAGATAVDVEDLIDFDAPEGT